MLGSKTQLSQGSVDDGGPPIQRRHFSITQAGTDRRGENDDSAVRTHNQWIQNNRHYDQSSSNAPIFNAPIYGSVYNNTQIPTLDGLHFLYHHAAIGAIHGSEEGNQRPRCHPGTREVVVRRIIGRHLDKDGRKKIMWVHAPAGYGKTAVAGTVKDELDVMELGFDTPVGATFFFWRGSPERNCPTRFIVTLAYQLAESIPELGPRVGAGIKSKPSTVKMALELQLIKLIVEPFQSLSGYSNMPTRLVIIDGIDECINSDLESRLEKKYAEDQEHVQLRVLDLIHCLHSHHLPLSFLILSRPEVWIVRHLGSPSFCDVVEPLDLSEVGDLMNDVQTFVRAELSRIAVDHGLEGADKEWPEEQRLIRRSQGNMLYASTVIRHIDDPYGDPRHLLTEIIDSSWTTNPTVLHSSPFSTLYELYRQIMRSCPERNRRLMIEVLEDIMGMSGGTLFGFGNTVGTAFRILDGLSGRPPGGSLKALRPLHSVLLVGRQHETRRIDDLFIHSTFRQFLKEPHISFDFVVDIIGGKERHFSYLLNCLASVTAETVGDQPDEVTAFALEVWCRAWAKLKSSLRSKTSYLRMMEKFIALDLTACIIQVYHIFSQGGPQFGVISPLFWAFNTSPTSTCFLKPPHIDVGECPDTLSIADKATAHWKSSLDNAFTSLLHATVLPSSTPLATALIAGDCRRYLVDVITEANWREHKLVQALGTPGPGGIALFKAIIKYLLDKSDGRDWRSELLGHIYEVLVRDQNPILEEEDHPFRRFLALDLEKARPPDAERGHQ